MRLALLLLTLALAGCPRMSNETVPVPRAQPVASKPTARKQVTHSATTMVDERASGSELAPPIPWLELGTGFAAASVPDEIVSEYPGASLSGDKSRLRRVEGQAEVWLQAFTTKAGEREIANYYNGLLTVKEFSKVDGAKQVGAGQARRQRKLVGAWRSADLRHEVQVYDSGVMAAGETVRPVFIVEARTVQSANATGGTGP